MVLNPNPKPPVTEAEILALERPDPALWTYYFLRCLIVPPLLPIIILPAWFRYHTMRYKFTDEGISMRWGILFRRESILNYARIQDIHLRSNIVERWLGLARIQVQTASGSATAEMTIEGLKQFEAVRDFLYSKMRGVKDATQPHPTSRSEGTTHASGALDAATAAELTLALRGVATELRAIRELLDRPPSRPTEGGRDV
jgi:membrane protein YdbS with pleckstrin-like domain